MRRPSILRSTLLALPVALLGIARPAAGQDQLGGHFGFAFPLVSRSQGRR
jgi:hypothetical protein